MKLILKTPLKENIQTLMRKAGYYFLEQKASELIFMRPLARAGYPRFHIYITENTDKKELLLNLHLDQKKPIYKGVTAHSGEYEGPLLENEIEKIKNSIS